MEKRIKLSTIDQELYATDIENMLDELSNRVQDFYDDYKLKIDSVSYDSTLNFEHRTVISFDINTSNIYPKLFLEISNLSRGFKSPLDRMFDGIFKLSGISQQESDDFYTQFGLTTTFLVKSNLNNPLDKTNDILNQAQKKINEWFSHKTARDIFLF